MVRVMTKPMPTNPIGKEINKSRRACWLLKPAAVDAELLAGGMVLRDQGRYEY